MMTSYLEAAWKCVNQKGRGRNTYRTSVCVSVCDFQTDEGRWTIVSTRFEKNKRGGSRENEHFSAEPFTSQ